MTPRLAFTHDEDDGGFLIATGALTYRITHAEPPAEGFRMAISDSARKATLLYPSIEDAIAAANALETAATRTESIR